MKVYLLMHHVPHNYTSVVSVFATEQLALAAIDEDWLIQHDSYDTEYDSLSEFSVCEYEVCYDAI